MPYENEPSSPSASSKFIKENLEAEPMQLIHSQEYQKKIFNALVQSNIHIISQNSSSPDNFKSIYAIDGSIIDLKQHDPSEERLKFGLQLGAAYLETQHLQYPQKDLKGNINPFFIAQLYTHPNNFSFSTMLPGKNVYTYDTNYNLHNLKTSFIHSIENMFENHPVGKKIYRHLKKDYFSQDNFLDCDKPQCPLKISPELKQCSSCSATPTSKINFIQKISSSIETDCLYADTKTESKNLMLALENFLLTYIIKNNPQQDNLGIVLDGRLQNHYVGHHLSTWLSENKYQYTNITFMGVQKSGFLNSFASSLHHLLKTTPPASIPDLKSHLERFQAGDGLFIILDKKFKEISGLKNISQPNSYGTECIFITSEPKRREFVMTLPQNKVWTSPSMTTVTNFLTLAQTDLYYKSKGALVANILAHENVSLNKKQTKRADEDSNMDKKDGLKKKI